MIIGTIVEASLGTNQGALRKSAILLVGKECRGPTCLKCSPVTPRFEQTQILFFLKKTTDFYSVDFERT